MRAWRVDAIAAGLGRTAFRHCEEQLIGAEGAENYEGAELRNYS